MALGKILACAVVLGGTACAGLGTRACAAMVDSGGSEAGYRHLDRAARAAYHGRLSEAIAQCTTAIEASPEFAAAFYQRAQYLGDAGRFKEAYADLETVRDMHPDSQFVYVTRARFELWQRNGVAALTDLNKAASLPSNSFWKRSYEAGAGEAGNGHGQYQVVSSYTVSNILAYRSIAMELLGQADGALMELQNALKMETLRPWYMLANHCYTAGVAGLLEMAELTCSEAIDQHSHDIGTYDSLGFVHLRMKAWDKAVADYDKALSYRPDLTLSLYGRGIAKHARGDKSGGDADIGAAKLDEPDIVNIMTRLGVPAI